MILICSRMMRPRLLKTYMKREMRRRRRRRRRVRLFKRRRKRGERERRRRAKNKNTQRLTKHCFRMMARMEPVKKSQTSID